MNLEPLLDASLAVKIHLLTVIPAAIISTWLIFFSVKGKFMHRLLGYAYLTLLTATSIAVLFVRELNPSGPFGFSWVHLFVPLTWFGVFSALYGVWWKDINTHRQAMIGVYFGAIISAGATAFIPGRLMYRLFFE